MLKQMNGILKALKLELKIRMERLKTKLK